MLNTDPQRSPKLPGNESQVRNIVIYSLNARLIERRDRLARYGVGLLNLRWCANPMGLRPSWVQIPLPAPPHPKRPSYTGERGDTIIVKFIADSAKKSFRIRPDPGSGTGISYDA